MARKVAGGWACQYCGSVFGSKVCTNNHEDFHCEERPDEFKERRRSLDERKEMERTSSRKKN